MNRFLLSTVAALALAGCVSTTDTTGKTTKVINPVLLQDGQLTIAGLQVLSADAATLGAPQAEVDQINAALATVKKAVSDLQAGSSTPQDFATATTDAINGLAPIILNDVHANQTIKTGVQLVVNMIPLIVEDISGAQKAPTAASIDRRGQLGGWVYVEKNKGRM